MQTPINLSRSEDKTAKFSNATQITVSDDTVVIQFSYVRPNSREGSIIEEIVLTPKHAINFNRALDATIKKHFTRHLHQLDANEESAND